MNRVPVLVVGGGGAGLTASMLLANLEIEHLLISSRPGTSDLPKAHVLNLRAMEILEDVGAADRIIEKSTPPEQMAATAFYAGFGGDDPDAGRRIAKLQSWGGGGKDENWRAASPMVQRNLPQIRLEPLLKERAEELSPGSIRFNQELVGLEQTGELALATIRDNDSGDTYEIAADYVIAADGGRTVPGLLGIEYEGLGTVSETATLHVSADFSDLAIDDDVLIRWTISPVSGAGVVMVPMGPEKWGPESEEWVIHIQYLVGDPREVTDEDVLRDVREAMEIGDFPMEIHKISRWTVDAVLASSFRKDRVFLVGDCAHKHPPTGGLGLTSAIHDVHNLAWKIAAVVKGEADESLLDTYEPERRPVVARNAQRSLENAINHLGTMAEIGVSPENSTEENWAAMKRLWNDDPADQEFREKVARGARSQSMEFNELNVEFGYSYDSTAVVPDGRPPSPNPDDVRIYVPSTRPGSPLPHAWLDDPDGNRLPIKDLVKAGRFLLIAGEEGDAWIEAANEIADAAGLPLDFLRIGHLDGDLYDPQLTWTRNRGIGADGAILVRPDRFVAWRAGSAAEDPKRVLAEALSSLLGREVSAPEEAAA
ncbi:MAG: FAD-dependent monooxygenase [Solirubrobacterales bacterium]|nr:FAD-dependent monooxygenase [Solirubrobacterales bacterium]MCB8915197.1 FAD-dependent monooxygenase [Thermoleophilales bacterium]